MLPIMKMRKTFRGLAVALVIGTPAEAQIHKLNPFVGDFSEGFESQVPGVYGECLAGTILGGCATICTPGTFGSSVGSQFTLSCTVTPNTGALCFASVDGTVEICFQYPISSFGGWFAVSAPADDATVTFFDLNDQVIGSSETAHIRADCVWYWNGWEVENTAIARMTIAGNSFNEGAFVEMDDLQIRRSNLVDTYCGGDLATNACPCGNQGGALRGCANSSSSEGAQLSVSGTSSALKDDLILGATSLPPGELVVFAEALDSGALNTPFQSGDGLRCIRGQMRRIEMGFAGSSGLIQSSQGIAASGQLSPGELRHYQVWYRDNAGSPCSTQTNMTNAISVLWTP